eukprot:snap_masked-scaffold_23-processed-gene-0.28-mRNA-1 protein AED:1.00 eAED:1.00 QI:0/-1/0/0/-1/1/1/0/94
MLEGLPKLYELRNIWRDPVRQVHQLSHLMAVLWSLHIQDLVVEGGIEVPPTSSYLPPAPHGDWGAYFALPEVEPDPLLRRLLKELLKYDQKLLK